MLSTVTTEKKGNDYNLLFEKKFATDRLALEVFNILENTNNSEHVSRLYDLRNIIQNAIHIRQQRISTLLADGEVRFESGKKILRKSQNTIVDKLNGIVTDSFLKLIIFKSHNVRRSVELEGEKLFISELNALVSHTNEFNNQLQTSDWIETSLRQQCAETCMQQTIYRTGCQIIHVISNNVQSEISINDIRFKSDVSYSNNALFIDNNTLIPIVITSDIALSNNANVKGNMNCIDVRPCNAYNLAENILPLSQQIWYQLNLFGNVRLMTKSAEESVFNFLEMALLLKSNENINAKLIYKIEIPEKITFNRIGSSLNQNNISKINTVDLTKLFNDAAVQTNDLDNMNQLANIHGKKYFFATENIYCGSQILLNSILTVNLVNDVNSLLLNYTIFNKPENDLLIDTWHNLMFLHAPFSYNIYVNETQTINSISLNDVVQINSEDKDKRLMVSFKNLDSVISNGAIDVGYVNSFSLQFFMKNRFNLLNRQNFFSEKRQLALGFINFENLILKGHDIRIDQINDVSCDDVVLKRSREKQQVIGKKELSTISSFFQIEKPFHTWTINDLEHVSLYAKAIVLNHKELIKRFAMKNSNHLKVREKTNVLIDLNNFPLLSMIFNEVLVKN